MKKANRKVSSIQTTPDIESKMPSARSETRHDALNQNPQQSRQTSRGGRQSRTTGDDLHGGQRVPARRLNRFNRREVRPIITVNELLLILGGGQRLEILSVLARGPLTVGAITQRLYLPIWVVSRELAMLEQRGLVVSVREKNYRWYRLTDHVRAVILGEMVQLSALVQTGHWVLVHLNESGDMDSPSPPTVFVGVT